MDSKKTGNWTGPDWLGLDCSCSCSCSCMLVGCNKKLVFKLVATNVSANQFCSKVGLVNTFNTHLKMLKMIKIWLSYKNFTNVTTFFTPLGSNYINIFINASILYQIQCFKAYFKARKYLTFSIHRTSNIMPWIACFIVIIFLTFTKWWLVQSFLSFFYLL